MKPTVFFSVLLVISGIWFSRTCAYRRSELKIGFDDDQNKCAEPVIRIMSAESSGNLTDFHEKSDMEKMKALHKELMSMMRNGNSDMRSYALFFDIMVEELGGEGGEDQFMDSLIGNMTLENREYGLNSTLVCFVLGNFELLYNESKKSIGTRVGTSDTFFPMIKDMVMSADSKTKEVIDSPTLLFVFGILFTFNLPEELFSQMSMVFNSMSESQLREGIHEIGPELKKSFSFSPFAQQ